jgi:hypothetical protein
MLLALVFVASLGLADELDAASQDALEQTQRLLTTPALRKQAGAPEHSDEMYGLASDIFEDMVKQAGGDPLKLQQMVIEAQKNPQAFAKKLSPSQRAQIKGMAERAPAGEKNKKP